jgi:Ca2+-binding RTX toxin-like protein
VVDSASDVVTEAAGAGNDQVESSLSYTLGANLENLTLTGTALNGTGNDGNNVLVGDGQDNILDGRAGNDQIEGGAGGDTASYASATAGVTVSLSSGLALGGRRQ